MRWWGVIALSAFVIVAETLLSLGAPATLSVATIVRTAIWLAPLWIIAWRYRKLFR